MAYWILKTEPSTYSFQQLVKERKTVWDGVKNPQAQSYIRSMESGDLLLIYHSGEGKCLVGLAEVLGMPYADPKHPNLCVVEIAAKQALKTHVTLAEIKAKPAFAELKLVRQSRLSVVPVPKKMWDLLMKMTGEEKTRPKYP
ncbi:MAG: EVE domain-containing protein [Bacteroidetes bacterium]|nr:EVE domain-containing protein [Bacteroidota bacterium]